MGELKQISELQAGLNVDWHSQRPHISSSMECNNTEEPILLFLAQGRLPSRFEFSSHRKPSVFRLEQCWHLSCKQEILILWEETKMLLWQPEEKEGNKVDGRINSGVEGILRCARQPGTLCFPQSSQHRTRSSFWARDHVWYFGRAG